MLLGQLLRPFGYLAIRHPYKWVVDWAYPAFLMTLTLVLVVAFGKASSLIANGGFVSLALSFVQSLPGFYIAALAAIATFGRDDIDGILPEPTPKLMVILRGHENLILLTRRRFLAILFAFLTAESIVITLYSIFLMSFGESFAKLDFLIVGGSSLVFYVAIAVFFLLLYQMILATFWGLYYLGYKLLE